LSRRGVSAEAIAQLESYVLQGAGELPELPAELAKLLTKWAREGHRGEH